MASARFVGLWSFMISHVQTNQSLCLHLPERPGFILPPAVLGRGIQRHAAPDASIMLLCAPFRM